MAEASEAGFVRHNIPDEPTEITLHDPRIFVPEVCLERCGKLANVAGRALLKAANYPNTQYDVICHDKKIIGCGAKIRESGKWRNDFGQRVSGTDEFFVGNIARLLNAGYPTVGEEIAVVIDAGIVPHYPSEIERS